MALAMTWIGVKNGKAADVLERLQLEPVGETQSELGTPFACVELPNGWLILSAPGDEVSLEDILAKFSDHPAMIGGETFDVVMFSRVLAQSHGETIWSVAHDPDEQPRGVAVGGDPPAAFHAVRGQIEAEQAKWDNEGEDVDAFFDLPGRLARSVCGYEPGHVEDLAWTALQPIRAERRIEPAFSRLAEAMRAELLPYLKSLGWGMPSEAFSMAAPKQMVRQREGQSQTLYFGFNATDEKPVINVKFQTRGLRPSGESHGMMGVVGEVPKPLTKRIAGLFSRKSFDERVKEAIGQAKADIQAAEVYLTIEERPPNILFYRRRDDVEAQPT